jgi:hypothetical protein
MMACDSAWADEDGMVMTRRTKITRLASGALLGEAGDDDSRHVQALFAHAKTPRSLPTRKQLADLALDYDAVLVLPKGKVYNVSISHDKAKGWLGSLFEVTEGYHAVGAGAAHALTAMDCNRSAKEAVNLAIKRNIHCRIPIHVVPLRKPPRSAAKPKRKRRAK